MTDPTPPDNPHPVDALVRGHLDREAARIDGADVLRRVSTNGVRPAVGRGLRLRQWAAGIGLGAGAVAAACLAIAFGAGTPLNVHAHTAVDLVRDSQQAHSDGTDRLYELKVERTGLSPQGKGPPPWLLLRDGKVWTRGDQFWMQSHTDGRPLSFGRDGEGRVWIVPNPQVGLLYNPDEVTEPLARACNLTSLRARALMAEMLASYDLSRADNGRQRENPIPVQATFRGRPGDFLATNVARELDPRSKVIRKAVVKRLAAGEAVATFTFTLLEVGRQGDEAYELAGHLGPARVIDQRQRDARDRSRAEFLKRFPWARPKP